MALAWSGLFAAFLCSLKRSQSMLLVSPMYCILYFTPLRFTYFKFLRFLMVGIWQTGSRWQVRFVHILYANRNSSGCVGVSAPFCQKVWQELCKIDVFHEAIQKVNFLHISGFQYFHHCFDLK